MPATAPQAVHMPMAGPRSRGANAATMIARELGVSSAAATPCRARATISASLVGAAAQASEKTPKSRTPISKMRRWP